jgi:hypothetical protein
MRGPPAMINSLAEVFQHLGIAPGGIRLERFNLR